MGRGGGPAPGVHLRDEIEAITVSAPSGGKPVGVQVYSIIIDVMVWAKTLVMSRLDISYTVPNRGWLLLCHHGTTHP